MGTVGVEGDGIGRDVAGGFQDERTIGVYPCRAASQSVFLKEVPIRGSLGERDHVKGSCFGSIRARCAGAGT